MPLKSPLPPHTHLLTSSCAVPLKPRDMSLNVLGCWEHSCSSDTWGQGDRGHGGGGLRQVAVGLAGPLPVCVT